MLNFAILNLYSSKHTNLGKNKPPVPEPKDNAAMTHVIINIPGNNYSTNKTYLIKNILIKLPYSRETDAPFKVQYT